MKTDRTRLYKSIENAIAKGVANAEEVDVIAKSIMDTVWPIIDFLQVHGRPSKDYVEEYIKNQNLFTDIKILTKILNMYDYIPDPNQFGDDELMLLMEFSGLSTATNEQAIDLLKEHKGKSINDIQSMIIELLNKVFPNT